MSINVAPQLCMVRQNLENLEQIQLPQGYSLRQFYSGDEAAWESIIAKSFGREANSDRFSIRMEKDPAYKSERVFFICFQDQPVATASAWYMEKYGCDFGYIHMVGVLPDHQGKQLGYWVNMACLHDFVNEGRKKAILQTDDFRLAAIKTYLKLGFAPYIVHESHPGRWNKILEILNMKSDYIKT